MQKYFQPTSCKNQSTNLYDSTHPQPTPATKLFISPNKFMLLQIKKKNPVKSHLRSHIHATCALSNFSSLPHHTEIFSTNFKTHFYTRFFLNYTIQTTNQNWMCIPIFQNQTQQSSISVQQGGFQTPPSYLSGQLHFFCSVIKIAKFRPFNKTRK